MYKREPAQDAVTTGVGRRCVSRASRGHGCRSRGPVVAPDLGCGAFLRLRRTKILGGFPNKLRQRSFHEGRGVTLYQNQDVALSRIPHH